MPYEEGNEMSFDCFDRVDIIGGSDLFIRLFISKAKDDLHK